MTREQFIIEAQREIINLQRLYILDLKKTLPLSDETRWGMMLEHAIKRLEEIHKPKKLKKLLASQLKFFRMELVEGKIKRTNLTDAEILEVVMRTITHLEEGDSISLARKKATKGLSPTDRRRVITHQMYVAALNQYLVRVGKGFQYRVSNGLLEVIKKLDETKVVRNG